MNLLSAIVKSSGTWSGLLSKKLVKDFVLLRDFS